MLYYHKTGTQVQTLRSPQISQGEIIMAKFNIISQFLKDISFESPNVPELFFKNDNGQAKLEINIDIQIKGAENNLFMVDLITKVHSKLENGDKSIFLIESTYSGLVQMEEEKDEEAKKRTLAMQPVDFAALYAQKQAK